MVLGLSAPGFRVCSSATTGSPAAVDEVEVQDPDDGWSGDFLNLCGIVVATANENSSLNLPICAHHAES